jgi:hypothetical protein
LKYNIDGAGTFAGCHATAKPGSLYLAQLCTRLGPQALAEEDKMLLDAQMNLATSNLEHLQLDVVVDHDRLASTPG